MMIWIRRQAGHLVDIVSKLELPPKRGREAERQTASWPEPDQLKRAIHRLGISARHFRLGGIFLRWGIRLAASSVLTSSKSLTLRAWHFFCESRQSKGHNVHCPCPQSGAQNEGLSTAKKVDGEGPIVDALKIYRDKTKPITQDRCSGERMCAHFLPPCGSIGDGGSVKPLGQQSGFCSEREGL